MSDTKNGSRFSFYRGWEQRRAMDSDAIRDEIMSMLGIRTRMGWQDRLYGRTEPKVTEVERINAIFAKYCITENIWGTADNETAFEIDNTL